MNFEFFRLALLIFALIKDESENSAPSKFPSINSVFSKSANFLNEEPSNMVFPANREFLKIDFLWIVFEKSASDLKCALERFRV